MLLHYYGKLFGIFRVRKICFQCDFLSSVESVQQISSDVMKIPAKINTMQNIIFLTFCSFTVLNKLKAFQLSKVGLLTIKHQHSNNQTPLAKAT